VGVDLSESMLSAASERFPEDDFRRGDLCRLDEVLDAPVDAILILGNSLCYLQDEASLRSCAEACARSLRPRGLLLVQLRRAGPAVDTVLPGRDVGDARIDRRMRPLGDMRYVLEIHRIDGDGSRLLCSDELRAWSAVELSSVFGQAGFTVSFHGDLHGAPDDAAATDIVVEAVVG
jgi:hypothetical protein